ncbi:MAG: adenylate/guanylate cyclase domain-containing protein, partial [Gammaproteobacteria bacterium]|nr:adenylate/guanylate cyclase domain-containing protein [Gammaproteobacteria bacterium]
MITKTARRRTPFVLAVIVWLAALAAAHWDAVTRLDNLYLDWNLRRLAAELPADPAIVMIDIDEPTLEAMVPEYGRYPWTRAVYGQLLEGLARQRPAAIVFDILFIDPHKEHLADDLYFVRTAAALPNVYFPMVRLSAPTQVERENGYLLSNLKTATAGPGADPGARAALLLPLQGLTETGRLGTINVYADADGIIRRYPMRLEAYGWHLPSLPARVAHDLGYAVPDADSLMITWHGPPRSYATVPFFDVFTDFERKNPQRPADEFRGKIVIIGTTASGLHDLKVTPLGADFPGTEVLATAIGNLRNGERLRAAPGWVMPGVTAIGLLVLGMAFTRGVSPLPAGIGLLLFSLAYAAGGWAAMSFGRTVIPVVSPLLFAWLYFLPSAIRAYWLERRDRQRVTQLFSRFLDPRVVTGLVEKGETDSTFSGQKREITVLFSDIQGFTSLSERKSAQEIVDLLNRYFSRQVEVIFRHQGTLDKYIGDAIMAFWGAPTDQPDHARRALECAREMQQTLLQFRKEMGLEGEHFDIGIGIHTGEAVVGFIGSPEHRQDYTVIGDTVNTASRIEGATRGRGRILVSASMRA